MKQEMKNHLLQSIEELKSQGKPQEESIKIAMDRFAEVNINKNREIALFKKLNLRFFSVQKLDRLLLCGVFCIKTNETKIKRYKKKKKY